MVEFVRSIPYKGSRKGLTTRSRFFLLRDAKMIHNTSALLIISLPFRVFRAMGLLNSNLKAATRVPLGPKKVCFGRLKFLGGLER